MGFFTTSIDSSACARSHGLRLPRHLPPPGPIKSKVGGTATSRLIVGLGKPRPGIIGMREGVRHAAGMYMVITKAGVRFLADTTESWC
jgi:hypothetical protein